MNPTKTSTNNSASGSGEAGQASILLILLLGTFLVGSLAFAVDLTGIWFHRQSAQTAADAACLAGAADLLAKAGGVTPPSPGFTAGTAGDCAATPLASMCKYANFNGYNGAGLSTTADSNSVSWTFPTAVTDVTTPTFPTNPFLRVLVTENVRTGFMSLFGKSYQQVAAACTCGVVPIKSSPPLLVLNPSLSATLSTSGNAQIFIFGGPTRSVQVNSTSATGLSSSGNSLLDTSAAGPAGTGADIATVGGPATAWQFDNLGTTGKWVNPTLPVPDPYGDVAAPAKPAAAPASTTVGHNVDGCPNASGCTEYSPGYYNSDIAVSGNSSAVFKPGIYYMDANVVLSGNATVRVAHSGSPPMLTGVMFYFNTGSMQTSGNAGSAAGDSISSDWLKCDSSAPSPPGVPATLNGNVLWSQCTAGGTYVGTGSSDTLSGTGTRGLLMFNAHTNSTTPTLSGNGSLLFSGVYYFHATGYGATWTLSGNGCSNTFLVGEIVTDNLLMGGNACVKMSLNAGPTTNVLKVALLQ
jgi:hypothetical protein